MTTIGILGAGQLGRMLALAGYPLGHRFRFLDPAAHAPAGLLAEHLAVGYADKSALDQFTNGLDVVTYEFENVPVETARHLEKFVPVYPPPMALEKAQDRFVEKSFFCELGIPTPRFTTEINRTFTFPAMLKTRRMGYDGQGQKIVSTEADLPDEKPQGMILEEFISFDRELSMIAVRDRSGEIRFYPLVENHHRDGILRTSLITGHAPHGLQQQAEEYVTRVLTSLDYIGVLAIEFFEKDGALLANEMAPRVHNSGHWTIEGAVTSQFENHLRAVTGMPLGDTRPLGMCAMVNLIGGLPEVKAILKVQGAHLHLYDKAPRRNRKIGHVTLVEKDLDVLQRKLDWLKEIVDGV